MNRFFNIFLALIISLLFFPVFCLLVVLIFLEDFKNPMYVSIRIGKNFKPFKIFKLRSMVLGADKNGPVEVSLVDNRITKIGRFIRKLKLDEFPQFINVIMGDMNVVGPRPRVKKQSKLFNQQEKKILLSVRPGITDISSLVFSDQELILKNIENPTKYYESKIKVWQSLLGLFYVKHKSFLLDLFIILMTFLTFFKKSITLKILHKFLSKYDEIPEELLKILQKKSKKA